MLCPGLIYDQHVRGQNLGAKKKKSCTIYHNSNKNYVNYMISRRTILDFCLDFC